MSGWFWAHGLGRWKLGGFADSAQNAQRDRAESDGEGDHDGAGIEPKMKIGEAVEKLIHVDELMAEANAPDDSAEHAGGHHDEGEF